MQKYFGSILKETWFNTIQMLILHFSRHFKGIALRYCNFAFYAKNPKASTDSDLQLSLILNKFDKEKAKYIFQLKNGSVFKTYNGKKFKLIRKIRKRYECKDLLTKKLYLFNPNYKICI